MTERSFFRESNIWRLAGGIIAFAGLILMIVFPTESYPDAIIYRRFNDKGQIILLFSVWHTIIAIGVLGFFPTLKEWSVKMFGKKQNES